ncbi:hypothetical protein GCK72_023102 [Caenorhabditis remanei]|uniref:Uncharacterized protein n=1 Tax=Caenorhabditis remanei TaxID=31234 RepID=A0A6A5FVV1_CAERE|nr:hypothetical protein GCK72_023102 [Caenorhabditis remanei]KAF1746645.1 hypothetical protein GCK72_023102 [Caenorhabditis remanei]
MYNHSPTGQNQGSGLPPQNTQPNHSSSSSNIPVEGVLSTMINTQKLTVPQLSLVNQGREPTTIAIKMADLEWWLHNASTYGHSGYFAGMFDYNRPDPHTTDFAILRREKLDLQKINHDLHYGINQWKKYNKTEGDVLKKEYDNKLVVFNAQKEEIAQKHQIALKKYYELVEVEKKIAGMTDAVNSFKGEVKMEKEDPKYGANNAENSNA